MVLNQFETIFFQPIVVMAIEVMIRVLMSHVIYLNNTH